MAPRRTGCSPIWRCPSTATPAPARRGSTMSPMPTTPPPRHPDADTPEPAATRQPHAGNAMSVREDPILDAIVAVVPPLLHALETLGLVARRLHPSQLAALARSVEEHDAALRHAAGQ